MTSRNVIRVAFEKCLTAVAPKPIVRDVISISPSSIQIASARFSRSQTSKIVVIGFGKASLLMADGARERIQEGLLEKSIVIAPVQQKRVDEVHQVFYGARDNLPDADSVEATREIIREIQKSDGDGVIFLFLISGGGSALLCGPRTSLKDKLTTIRLMQAKGATIQELNVVRQKLSSVKGGRLLEHITRGKSVSLIISDVIGDRVELIASGPTVVKEKTEDSVEILKRLGISPDELPSEVKKILLEVEKPATSQKSSQNFIISSNEIALRAASEALNGSGFHTKIVTSSLSGNAAEIGRRFGELISSESLNSAVWNFSENTNYPMAFLFGGETTVKLAEKPGKGGRNQEMVLACLDYLKTKAPRHKFTFLSAGTDGQDGPTDAAGALISNADLLLSSPKSSEYLANSDSYNFWKLFNNGSSHILTGPSGTNVMDIQILLLDAKL